MVGPPGELGSVREALRGYLSGTRAPGSLADSLPRLEGDVEGVADVIVQWAGDNAPAGSRPDYESLALRRILALGTLGAVPTERLTALVRTAATAVLFRARTEDRSRLATLLGPLVKPAQIPKATAAAGGVATAKAPSSPRLTLLLDRLDVLKKSGPEVRSPGELVAETMVTAALQARTAADIEATIQDLVRRGTVRGTADLFRVLVQALPSYWTPGSGPTTTPAALLALERLCALAGGPEEGARRFREMVEAAVREFNQGALGRAGRVFELAERILEAGEVEAALVEPLRQTGHEQLNLERVRRLVESRDRSALSPAVLRFFRVFAPDAIIDKMRREPRQERRRLLLAFLETHGPEGRRAARERMGQLSDHEPDFYLLRNLVHLLRTIPRPPGSPIDPELARVARLLVPENPPYLVNEVVEYLGEARHPVAVQVLVAFLRSLEDGLLDAGGDTWEEDRRRYRAYLDRTSAALARQSTPGAWTAVVEHGLKTDGALGNAAARLADLAACDLSQAPRLAARLVAAAQAALPKGVLAEPGPGVKARLLAFVTALSGTRLPEVKELFEALSARFSDQEAGELAARALRAWSSGATLGPDGRGLKEASLSGDLEMFALPTLLQNLAEMHATGDLTLLDDRGRRRASLTVAFGRIASARYGRLSGAAAVFEMLERPFGGTFAFRQDAPASGKTGEGFEVTEIILEGLRRHDELRRAALLAPDGCALEVTGLAPSAVPGEADIDFVTALWEKAVSGISPLECEPLFAVDAYRVRRCLAYWLEAGALRLGGPNGDNPGAAPS